MGKQTNFSGSFNFSDADPDDDGNESDSMSASPEPTPRMNGNIGLASVAPVTSSIEKSTTPDKKTP